MKRVIVLLVASLLVRPEAARAASARQVEKPDPSVKMTSILRAARDATAARGSTQHFIPFLRIDGQGNVEVRVSLRRTDGTALRELREAGLHVEIVNEQLGVARGPIAMRSLDALAALANVTAVRPPNYAVPQVGSVTGRHDEILGCAGVREAFGLDGSGVRIGVISDGIFGLDDAQASGNAPPVVVPSDGRCRPGRGSEGTAMIELIHDCAPGAEIGFCGPSDDLEMIDCVGCLREAFGAQVLVDDLGFFLEPYFEDGPVARAVEAAVADGAAYFSAAGNSATSHYQAPYRVCPDGSTRHDFGSGDCMVDATVSGPVGIVLQWKSPFGAARDDYDLCVTGCSRTRECSEDLQNGDDDPIEIVACNCPERQRCSIQIEVMRFGGEHVDLEIYAIPFQSSGGRVFSFEHLVEADSVFGHPCVEGAFAIGAIDASDSGVDMIEPFSSRGPCTIGFPSTVERRKPDLTGLDGISHSRPGAFPSPFFGTSAAAPGVAAVGALLLDLAPGLSPTALREALEAGAVDVGPAGFDFAFGAGRVDAVAAAGVVQPPTATPIPAPTPTPGPCRGDCNGDGLIAVDELVRGVNIALGNSLLSTCPQFDDDGDGRVSVDELILSVAAAVHGCIPR